MIVDVIGPVAVAALLSGNETVDVIETVDDADATSGSKRPMLEHARGSAMESAAHLDVMRVEEVIDA